MALSGVAEEAGIPATQLGYPLAHRREDFSHRVSSDGLVTGAGGSSAAASEPEGKEVADHEFIIGSIHSFEMTEGAGDAEGIAPEGPACKRWLPC